MGFKYIYSFIFMICFISACSDFTYKTPPKSSKEERFIATKTGFEKKINEFGLAIYKDAVFKEIKQSRDGHYMIKYDIPLMGTDSRDSVSEFYDKEFGDLSKRGWRQKEHPAGLLWYVREKDNIIFDHKIYASYNMHTISFRYWCES